MNSKVRVNSTFAASSLLFAVDI